MENFISLYFAIRASIDALDKGLFKMYACAKDYFGCYTREFRMIKEVGFVSQGHPHPLTKTMRALLDEAFPDKADAPVPEDAVARAASDVGEATKYLSGVSTLSTLEKGFHPICHQMQNSIRDVESYARTVYNSIVELCESAKRPVAKSKLYQTFDEEWKKFLHIRYACMSPETNVLNEQ